MKIYKSLLALPEKTKRHAFELFLIGSVCLVVFAGLFV